MLVRLFSSIVTKIIVIHSRLKSLLHVIAQDSRNHTKRLMVINAFRALELNLP